MDVSFAVTNPASQERFTLTVVSTKQAPNRVTLSVVPDGAPTISIALTPQESRALSSALQGAAAGA